MTQFRVEDMRVVLSTLCSRLEVLHHRGGVVGMLDAADRFDRTTQ